MHHRGQEGTAEWLLLCLQNPKENSLILHCSFPLSTYVLTMTDNSGVHSLKRTSLLQWMKSCFAYPYLAPFSNQSKSNFRFLLDQPDTDLAEDIQVRWDQSFHVLLSCGQWESILLSRSKTNNYVLHPIPTLLHFQVHCQETRCFWKKTSNQSTALGPGFY